MIEFLTKYFENDGGWIVDITTNRVSGYKQFYKSYNPTIYITYKEYYTGTGNIAECLLYITINPSRNGNYPGHSRYLSVEMHCPGEISPKMVHNILELF